MLFRSVQIFLAPSDRLQLPKQASIANAPQLLAFPLQTRFVYCREGRCTVPLYHYGTTPKQADAAQAVGFAKIATSKGPEAGWKQGGGR